MPNQNLCQLYNLFWGVSQSPSFVKFNIDIPDVRTLELGSENKDVNIIRLPAGVAFPHGGSDLLITPIYETFWDLVREDDQAWQSHQDEDRHSYPTHGTVIKGQPGIGKFFIPIIYSVVVNNFAYHTGKTVFLSYLLIRRLQEKLVTVFCNQKGFAHVFSDAGVKKVLLKDGSRILELDENSHCCALVNISDRLESVPFQFYPDERRGRVAVATSPNPAHLANFSHEHSVSTYCMPTWSWSDLYCCR